MVQPARKVAHLLPDEAVDSWGGNNKGLSSIPNPNANAASLAHEHMLHGLLYTKRSVLKPMFL
jgi:hypothetical protein